MLLLFQKLYKCQIVFVLRVKELTNSPLCRSVCLPNMFKTIVSPNDDLKSPYLSNNLKWNAVVQVAIHDCLDMLW